MKRPSFQFYPADWRNNTKLQRSSFSDRGIWLEVMCLMHDSDEYGVLRWPLEEIARVIGCKVRELAALVKKEILKGSDTEYPGYAYRPRHAGKDGPPITLVETQKGPIWFSSRMVVDEYLRLKRGATTRFTSDSNPNLSTPSQREGIRQGAPPSQRQGARLTVNHSRQPSQRHGHGATSSSSSSLKEGLDLNHPTRPGDTSRALIKTSVKPMPFQDEDREAIERNRMTAQAIREGKIGPEAKPG